MTLNDLELLYGRIFSEVRRFRNEDRPVLSATKLYPIKCSDCVHIGGRSCAGGGVKQGCGRKTCCFDLDGVIEDFVRFNDQRKDNFGLQTSWQQCQTLDSYNVSVALLHCECVTR